MSNLAKHEDILQSLDKDDIKLFLGASLFATLINKLPDIIDALGRIGYRLNIQTKVGSIDLEPATSESKAA